MHTLVLVYPDNRLSDYCDRITHCAVIDLFLRGIHASQSAHDTIILHDARDLTAALLVLSNSTLYTLKMGSNSTI